MFEFAEIVDAVPDYQEFLTVEEMDNSSKALAAKYPDLVKLEVVGQSRQGHDILKLKIGDGKKNAFMFACPHPNEPIGAMTVEYFSKALVENPEFLKATDYTWHIIKCIDIDGTKLNENWFKGPFTLTNYTRNYFRPAAYEQAEWTFPIEYKDYSFNEPIPETQVLMDVIDDLKPEFLYSLHNAGFGGTYWYISKDMPNIWEDFYKASEKNDVPLHLGEPEVPYITPFASAIYPMISKREEYDYLEKYSDKDPVESMVAGDSSYGYTLTKNLDTVTLVTEMPYFSEPRIQSDKLMDFTRREIVLENLENQNALNKKIKQLHQPIAKHISDDNPFMKMVEMSLDHHEDSYNTRKTFVENNEEYGELAKESEAFDNIEFPKFAHLFYWTLLLRGCEFELTKDHSEDVLALFEDVRIKSEAAFDKQAEIAESSIDYQVIPIRNLVRVQLECGLIVASNL